MQPFIWLQTNQDMDFIVSHLWKKQIEKKLTMFRASIKHRRSVRDLVSLKTALLHLMMSSPHGDRKWTDFDQSPSFSNQKRNLHNFSAFVLSNPQFKNVYVLPGAVARRQKYKDFRRSKYTDLFLDWSAALDTKQVWSLSTFAMLKSNKTSSMYLSSNTGNRKWRSWHIPAVRTKDGK